MAAVWLISRRYLAIVEIKQAVSPKSGPCLFALRWGKQLPISQKMLPYQDSWRVSFWRIGCLGGRRPLCSTYAHSLIGYFFKPLRRIMRRIFKWQMAQARASPVSAPQWGLMPNICPTIKLTWLFSARPLPTSVFLINVGS